MACTHAWKADIPKLGDESKNSFPYRGHGKDNLLKDDTSFWMNYFSKVPTHSYSSMLPLMGLLVYRK